MRHIANLRHEWACCPGVLRDLRGWIRALNLLSSQLVGCFVRHREGRGAFPVCRADFVEQAVHVRSDLGRFLQAGGEDEPIAFDPFLGFAERAVRERFVPRDGDSVSSRGCPGFILPSVTIRASQT